MVESNNNATSSTTPAVTPETPQVVVELRHDSQIAYQNGRFVAAPAKERAVRSLNDVLEKFEIQHCGSHFGMPQKSIDLRATEDEAPRHLTPRTRVSADFAQAGFVKIVPKHAEDGKKLLQLLRHPSRKSLVWGAFLEPHYRPATLTLPDGISVQSRDFEPSQGYLYSPPFGIGAFDVWPYTRGKGMTICDIEGDWDLQHEGLPDNVPILSGTRIGDTNLCCSQKKAWLNHGAAVLGILVGQPGKGGTVGICPEARIKVQPYKFGDQENVARAIMNAILEGALQEGDMILIELEAPPHQEDPQQKKLGDKPLAIQFLPHIQSAIRAATARGITVVEAAGNGGVDFQKPVFAKTGLQKDIGAIVVGAGAPPINYYDYYGDPYGKERTDGRQSVEATRYTPIGTGPDGISRSRAWFSNYGQIVNVQAWGWNIATLGYGDAQGGENPRRWYTLRFGGTSGAAAIVAGAVAWLQSWAIKKRGQPLKPEQIRRILIETGTPQQPGSNPGQHIGPQPNLLKAKGRVKNSPRQRT